MLEDIGHALSFEILFENTDFKIITAHNSFHSQKWLPYINDNDIVIFSDAFYSQQSETQLEYYKKSAPVLNNLYFLSNDIDMHRQRLLAGFPNCHTINQNAFIDPNLFYPEEVASKDFDFIYNARPRSFKRHWLAKKASVKYDLALILGNHASHLADVDPKTMLHAKFVNEGHLSPEKVRSLYNKSKVGIILSDIEGACFSSSEYLMCGLPVISTESKGGRDIWYNELNSILIEDSEDALVDALDRILNNPIDNRAIRENIVEQVVKERKRFLDTIISPIFDKMRVDFSPLEWFEKVDYRGKMVFQRANSWKRLPEIYKLLTEK